VADTRLSDIRHFVDQRGGLHEDLPDSERSLAGHLGRIIMAATSPGGPAEAEIEVPCRRRTGRNPCPGTVRHMTEPGGEERIFWRCAVCGDNGEISNWQGSIWDCREKGVPI